MKPIPLIFASIALLAVLAYKLFGTESLPEDSPREVLPVDNRSADDVQKDHEAVVRDLEPRAPPVQGYQDVQAQRDATPAEVVSESEVDPLQKTAEEASSNTIIQVKTPQANLERVSVVSLVSEDVKNGRPKQRLDDPALAFEQGQDAIVALGDQLNALNGTYNGELIREGKDSCPVSITIDGFYTPAEGSKKAGFTGKFILLHDCPGARSRLESDNIAGQVKVVTTDANANSKSIMMDDGHGYYHLNFSNDFQSVSGNIYVRDSSGVYSLLGPMSAHR